MTGVVRYGTWLGDLKENWFLVTLKTIGFYSLLQRCLLLVSSCAVDLEIAERYISIAVFSRDHLFVSRLPPRKPPD